MNPLDYCILWNKLGKDIQVDNSPVGVDGTRTGTVVYATGKFDNGVNNANLANYVAFTNAFNTGQVIVEFWYKPGHDSSSSSVYFPIYSGTGDFYINHQSADTFRVFVSNGVILRYEFPVSYSSGDLVHFIMTHDNAQGAGDRVRLWQDGDEKTASVVTENSVPGATETLNIGRITQGTGGVIDNVRLYNIKSGLETKIISNMNFEGLKPTINILI